MAGLLFVFALFIGMIVLLELGRRLRWYVSARNGRGPASDDGLGTIEAAVFGVLGLLLAFTFAGAAARFDARRLQAIDEVNAISTAYLRLDLLQGKTRTDLQELFRQYMDARLAYYAALPDSVPALEANRRREAVQREIWNGAVTAVSRPTTPGVSEVLLPALNTMFDLAASRVAAPRIHPPLIIYGLLGLVALVSALLAGYGMAPSPARSWLHMVALPAILAFTIYVIVDLEYPRAGILKISSIDELLVDARATMK